MAMSRRAKPPAPSPIGGVACAPRAAAQGPALAGPRLGNRPVLRFFATFALLASVYFVATLDLRLAESDAPAAHPFTAALVDVNQWMRRSLLEPYHRGIAAVSALLLGAIGHPAEAQGREIRSPGFAVVITGGCDAIEPSLLLCGALFSFPARWRERIAGLLLGAAAIAALNVVRVATLWLVGLHWRAAFDTIHFTIWPFLIVVFTLGLFLLWLRQVTRATPAQSAPVS